MHAGRHTPDAAFRDVTAYGPAFLRIADHAVCIPVTYRREWQDGFGARGWKLDVTLDDPEIIASTPETGTRIPTSVFVHDIFDHLLCGFAVSGHRAEAMALSQLADRTGADIAADYAQMVREDLRAGRLIGLGDSLAAFVGDALLSLLDEVPRDPRALATTLRTRLGEDGFEAALVQRFHVLGKHGDAHAHRSWERLGFAWDQRAPMALALQRAFAALDTRIECLGVEAGKGAVRLDPCRVAIELQVGDECYVEESRVEHAVR